MDEKQEGKAEWLETLSSLWRLRFAYWALQHWDCGCKMGGAYAGYGMKQLESEGQNAQEEMPS